MATIETEKRTRRNTEEKDTKNNGKTYTWIEAIEKVLEDEGRPIHYSDMPELIIERGYKTPSMGATPSVTVQVSLSKHLKEKKENARIVKVGSGTYTLKKFLDKFDDSEDEQKEQYIIQSFGIMWNRNLIHWKNSPDIYGIQNAAALPVNFAKQTGVYCLIDGRETIYVGQAFSQTIGERLCQHTKDRFSGRWDRFSWFGLHSIDQDTGKLIVTNESTRCISIENMCHTLEAILIEGIEPRQNRKSGNKFSGIEYNQHPDPELEKKNFKKFLDEMKEKFS